MHGIKDKFKALPKWQKIVIYIFGFFVLMALIGPPSEKNLDNNIKESQKEMDDIDKELSARVEEDNQQGSSPEFGCMDYTKLSDGYQINATKCLAIMKNATGQGDMDSADKQFTKDVDNQCKYPKSAGVSQNDEISLAVTNFNGYVLAGDKEKVQEYGRRCKELMDRAISK